MTELDPDAIEHELQTSWVRRAEAASIARLSAEHVRTLAVNGKIKAINTPAGMLFRRTDLERVAQEPRGRWARERAKEGTNDGTQASNPVAAASASEGS